jgi:hypothetical protein
VVLRPRAKNVRKAKPSFRNDWRNQERRSICVCAPLDERVDIDIARSRFLSSQWAPERSYFDSSRTN